MTTATEQIEQMMMSGKAVAHVLMSSKCREHIRRQYGVAGAKMSVPQATGRIKAIMSSPEAKGREHLAKHFAYSTDLSADAAIAALKVAPMATSDNDNRGNAKPPAQGRMAATLLAGGGGKPASEAGKRQDLADIIASFNDRRFNVRR
jgi:hypothetical protein